MFSSIAISSRYAGFLPRHLDSALARLVRRTRPWLVKCMGTDILNAFNFDFTNQREKLTLAETKEKATRNECGNRGAPLPAPNAFPLTVNEGERFLRFVARISRIECHHELFQLLQTEEVQHFIPHQVLISAWGNFSAPSLKLDVISAIPGLRTGLLNLCTIDGLIKDLYKRWLLHGRQPLLLSSSTDAGLAHLASDCALRRYLQGSWSLLVHGFIDARDGSASLYLALNARSIVNGHGAERFRFLAESLITQIDAAYRRITALQSPGIPVNQDSPVLLRTLSAREEEVLLWVSEGKTNVDISKILAVSLFTVKNHLQRIMDKLNAANRTEAAVKYHQMGLQTANKKPDRNYT